MENPEISPEDQKEFSVWTNPTNQEVVLPVFVGHPGGIKREVDGKTVPISPWKNYTWAPGASRQLPAEYDSAVHKLAPDGITIIGGGAPQLVKKGYPRKIHPDIDTEFQRKKSDLEKAANMLQQKQFFDNALTEIAVTHNNAEKIAQVSEKKK